MRRERLRPAWSPEELAKLYVTPHDHRRYGRGHGERVEATVALAQHRLGHMSESVADLSCGNGVIATGITCERLYLGDFAPGYEYCGPLEQTIDLIPPVDVFVLSETLEHLDDPLKALMQIAAKAHWLVLTTPIEAWGDTNEEHLWAWDREAVEFLLEMAGFGVASHWQVDSRVYGEPYIYGLWVAERT